MVDEEEVGVVMVAVVGDARVGVIVGDAGVGVVVDAAGWCGGRGPGERPGRRCCGGRLRLWYWTGPVLGWSS